jgi:hypothetical protein
LIRQGRLRPPNFGRAGGSVMETAARPPRMQFSPDAPKRHPMLPAEALQGLSRAQRRTGVATQYFEKGFPAERKGHRRGVAQFGRAPIRCVDPFARSPDLAQLPRR